MIYYVGDIHGHTEHVIAIDKAAQQAGVKFIVQVGDFGILWNPDTCSIAKYFDSRATSSSALPTWFTCGGNHDNWSEWRGLKEGQGSPELIELAPKCFYVQRATTQIIGGVPHLFLGGTESIDRGSRTEGIDWWREESPSYGELSEFANRLETDKPHVVVTHDAPMDLPIYDKCRLKTSTPRSLQHIVDAADYMPTHWYFGHHHVLKSWRVEQTTYHCCGLHGQYLKFGEEALVTQ